MNQLGIIYRLTASEQGKGFDAYVLESNENLDGWKSAVTDERDIWFSAAMEANNAIALTILKSGIILTASRLTHGTRPTDNMTIWVYIQSSLAVTPEQWTCIITEMQKIVSSPQLPTLASFNTLQSMDFAISRYPISHIPSDLSLTNRNLAYRIYTSSDQLAEILDNVDQNIYKSYRHIFLYNRQPVALQRPIDDLSSHTLTKYMLAIPPAQDEVIRIFNSPDIQLYYNGKPFTTPQPVTSQQIQLEARRPGFEPMPLTATVSPNEMPVALQSGSADFYYVIKRQDIKVTDENGKNIDQIATVRVYNTQVHNRQNVKIPEKDINNINLTINANGYESFDETISFSRLSQPFRLKARKETIEANTYLETVDGKPIPVKISLTGSHLAKTDNQDVTLHIEKGRISIAKSGEFIKGLLWGIGGCVVLALLIWGGIFAYNSLFGEDETASPRPDDNTEFVEEEYHQEDNSINIGDMNDPADSDQSYKDAVDYLQNKCRTTDGQDFCLDKNDMSQYPALNNVYDYVNTGDLDALTGLGEISQIEPLRTIIAKLQEMKMRKLDFSKLFPGGYSSDGRIQVSNFNSRINDKIKALEMPKQTSAKKIGNNGTSNRQAKAADKPKTSTDNRRL